MSKNNARPLGVTELIAIALGGMVGGGIFSILGISVEHIGNAAPLAIMLGGLLALLAAYSYTKLALYYQRTGETYVFFKLTFNKHPFAASIIGYLVVFGYISTLALYAYTFAAYFSSHVDIPDTTFSYKVVAAIVIALFAALNIFSVSGMGKIEDFMVYLKIAILLIISVIFVQNGDTAQLSPILPERAGWTDIFMIAAVTFVAYEGFQLIFNAYNEVDKPQQNIARAVYSAIIVATLLYVLLAIAALLVIPKAEIIAQKEAALSAGAANVIGKAGEWMVVFGALLATASAINGTLYGASRLVAVIADDGYMPGILAKCRNNTIPYVAIIMMSLAAFALILTGSLRLILEVGSMTFILVAFLMSMANFRIRDKTHTHALLAMLSMAGLALAAILIIVFEFYTNKMQLVYIGGIYITLTALAWVYASTKMK